MNGEPTPPLTKEKRLPMGHFRAVPLSDLTTPKNGRIVYADRWWAVNANDEALFYVGERRKSNSAQCNVDRRVVERIMPEGCRAVHIPVAYVEHNCNDYV